MAKVTNLYADALCTNPVYQLQPGQAGLVGYWADPANWTIQQIATGKEDDQGNPLYIRATYINKDKNGASVSQGCDFGLAASGGAILYDLRTAEDSFEVLDDVILSDTVNNGTTQAFTNAFFSGVIDYGEDLKRSAFVRFSNGIYNRSVFVQVGSYRQTPAEADKDQRQTWNYETSDGYYASSQMFCRSFQAEIAANSQWGFVRVYSLVIGGVDCYAFFVGVDFAGGFNDTGNYTSYIIAVPKDLYKDKIPRPYVGPVSKDSAEGSFVPVRPWDDSIPSRTISDANPYGFNSGNGLRLTVLPKALYSYIMQGIYTGYSDSYINAASQLIDRVIGGSGHRPADEVRAIVGGVLCCHSVPALTNYVSGLASDIRTICGYRCFSLAASFPLAGQMIYTIDTARFNLAPRLNSFLDYEPFTAISLHVPFCGMCSLQPSQAYGNDIYLHYVVDIYSGAVSCDVHIAGTTGGKTEYKDYVYTTLQGSFATDMPVMGAGATQSPLQQIAKGVTGITTAQLAANTATGSRAALAAADLKAAKLSAAIGAAETIETAGRGTAIGSASSEGLASYLSNRAVYVIIDRPEPAVPEGYAEMQGVPAHLGGTVGGFGGWTEFEAVDLSSVTQATQAEKEQIIRELKAGVFV